MGLDSILKGVFRLGMDMGKARVTRFLDNADVSLHDWRKDPENCIRIEIEQDDFSGSLQISPEVWVEIRSQLDSQLEEADSDGED